MRDLSEIIVHCTATRADWMITQPTSAKVAEVKRWHVKDRGWSDIGYHYLIDRDGTIAVGRPLSRVGAHVQGHNTGSIGISLFGGHGSNENDQFSENFTSAQGVALRSLISDLKQKYPTITKVTGHNQYAAKACPGFKVPEWYENKTAENTKTEKQPIPPKTLKVLQDSDKAALASTTNWASIGNIVSALGVPGILTSLGQMDWKTAAVIAATGFLLSIYIMFERSRKAKLAKEAREEWE